MLVEGGGEVDERLGVVGSIGTGPRDEATEMTAALAGRPGSVNPAAADAATLTPEDQERRQNFWWYLLMAGIVLLGLETAISNRMKGPVEGTRITPTASA